MGSSLLRFPVLIMQCIFFLALLCSALPQQAHGKRLLTLFYGRKDLRSGQDSSQATTLSMLEPQEQLLELPLNILPINFSTHVEEEETGTKIQTIGFLEDRLCKMPVWDSPQDLPELLWQIMHWEILVGDRSSIYYVIKIPMKIHNKFKIE